MKKLFAGMLIFLMGMTGAYAKSSGNFSSVINDSGLEKNSIAISIKKLDTGKPVYELNEKILMHPASVQKLLTLPAAIDVLGEDYEFTTSVYKRSDDSFDFFRQNGHKSLTKNHFFSIALRSLLYYNR